MSMNPELCASAQDQRHDADKDRSVRGLEVEQASIWWPSLSTLPQRSLSWPAMLPGTTRRSGSSHATFSSPSVTTKSWTNFCTAWPSPRAAFCPISSSSSQEVQRKGLDADSSPYNPRNGALLGQSWELQLQTVTQHGEGGEVSCGGEVQLHRSHGEEVGDKQQPVGGPCVETKSNRSWRWEIVLQCPGIAH